MSQTQIRITTNAAEVSRWLSNSVLKKMDQAAKQALSKTVLQVQHAERVEINEDFLNSLEYGGVIRVDVKYIHGVFDLRKQLRALADTLDADFVVYGIEDPFFYFEKTAAVIKVERGSHYEPIRAAVVSLLASMQEGESALLKYENIDVFNHVAHFMDEYQALEKKVFEFEHHGDAHTITIERQAVGTDKASPLSAGLSELARKKISARPGIDKPYHDTEVGEACAIEFDGTKAKESSQRSIVYAYGKRAGKKFTVKKAGDTTLTITRTA